MTNFLVPLLLVLLLAGCAEDPADLHELSRQELQSVSDRDLCEA